MAECSAASSKWMFLIHHVFLPPKLPQEDDASGQDQEYLAQQALEALRTFKAAHEDATLGTQATAIGAATSAVSNLLRVHNFSSDESDATINSEDLQEALEDLVKTDSSRPIILHVTAQNAGVLVYRHDNSVVFEMFELSAQNHEVMGTKGRLLRKFPGVAIQIPTAKLEPALIRTVACTLERMSGQVVAETIPTTSKAGRVHEEIRDTAHPKVVTELLTAFLLPFGQAAEVTSISKHTRDDVLWKNCKKPWRRSPLWLLLKVCIQLVFLRSGLEEQDALDLYKHFMVCFAGHILSQTASLLEKDPVCLEWCDIVYTMRAKISRRVLKLRKSLPTPIQIVMADNILQRTWDDIRRSEAQASTVEIESLESLDFEKDTHAKLPKLDEFIDSISKRKGETMQVEFTPSCRLPELDNIADLSGRGSLETPEPCGIIGAWCDVQVSNLNAWLNSKLQKEPLDATSSCTALWNDMKAYEEMVHKCCGQNPEAISLMVLGVMELWVACDRLACKECPLLLEYDPDIDVCRLQSLLLPFPPQMKRLHAVEDYVERRQKAGIHKHIWTSFGQADTFAARYFDRSAGHKALRLRIEESARETRERKVNLFTGMKQLYSTLMNATRTMECSQVTEIRNGQEYRSHRPSSCGRCIKKNRAAKLHIDIHEWPLPSTETDLKTVVFELNVPRWFSVWREATNLVRFKLLQCSYALEDSPHQQFPLQDDLHLKSHFASRLPAGTSPSYGLLSSVKPHARTHYKGKPISGLTRVDEVLFDNASRFQYFDSFRGCMAAVLSPTEGIESLTQSMTYQLPSRSQAVQQFIYRPPTSANGPGPNVVLSSQSDCPSHLSLTEYKALCTIPQGLCIQWQNILLEVTAPHIDFKKEETAKVVLQCIYQAGPDDDSNRWCRDAHLIPAKSKAFGPEMLKALHDATARIEKNWRCIDELACYIAIAHRILSLSPSDALMWDVLAYLFKAREVGLSWVNTLKKRVDSAIDDDKCRFRSRVAHAALVCVDTFNFQDTFSEGKNILELQFATDITDFISCCITIQECYTPTSEGLDPILYWRWQQLCFHAYPILHHAIIDNSSEGLNVAIRRSWVAFKPTDSGWTSWPIPGCRHGGIAWLTTESASTSGGRNLAVHYCLVTGELRVNGLPLNRLPREYDTDPMYKTLFGRSMLEVMPGDVPGMIFSGKKRYAGHEVHFGLSPGVGNQRLLLVRAVKNDQSWELVDPEFLQGFPHRFVSGYVHWYDLSSNTIEFRPLEEPWVASVENWKLGVSKKGEWQLTKGNDRILVVPKLLNAQSETAERMDKIFGPLVEAANLELVYRPLSSQLEIELPALKLAFHLEKGSSTLQSRQFRGMSVDPDQDIGTLIGFENKLVLKSNSQDKRRKVSLLEGPMTRNLRNSYTRVHVAKGVAVLSHAYNVDIRLGRLEDNGSLESKLLLCYLHALTSFCLPDPVMKRTGTEQALDILNSAAVESFDVFSSKHIDMLGNIAALTPKRLHYPRHLQVMQQVSWSTDLGFLAQHNGFYKAVTSLFDGVADRAFFYKDRYIKPPKLEGTRELVRRDEIRTAAFRVSDYGAEEHTTKKDREYPSRDMGQDSAKCHTAFSIADYIVNRRERLPEEIPASPGKYIWNYLKDVAGESVLGAMHPLNLHGTEDTPEYDAQWLLDTHNKILGKNIILYHELLSGRRQGTDKFDTTIWLSTLAFSKKADLTVIQLLAACLNTPALASIEPPPGVRGFTPSLGHTFVKTSLLSGLNCGVVYHPFNQSPEYRASKGKGYETQEESRSRYSSLRRQALNAIVECVSEKWPCAKPSLANHPREAEWKAYVKTSNATTIVQKRTLPWFKNHLLEDYLSRIVNLLPGSRSVSVDELLAVKHSASRKLLGDGPQAGFIRMESLFLCPPPQLGQLASATAQPAIPVRKSAPGQMKSGQHALLGNLLYRLDSMAQFAFQKDYVAKLQQSVDSLATRKCESVHVLPNAVEIIEIVEAYLAACKDRSGLIYKTICDTLNSHMSSLFAAKLPRPDLEPGIAELCFSNHWPRLSPSFLLQNLAREKRRVLSFAWKLSIVEFGVALVAQQRAERMMAAARRNDMAALSSELLNQGHENWDPTEYPDSLLLEVESGITIRRVQEEIAARMRSPPGGRNAVMQLNMGEGKSSVIVPIVASALADGERLVRVFVAKPQSKQMLEMLTSKLGGLLDRVVFQMPISRDLQVTKPEAESIREMLEKCREVGGVLLLQPEHALSLQQMGTEFAISPDKQDAANVLNQIRHFLHRAARDIVDESDENFSVKFELVYTMGLQQPVDHSPQRWKTIQEVLGLVRDIVPEVQQEFPDAIEVQDTLSLGSFPRTRVLKPEAMQRVLDKLVKRICDTGMAGFPIPRQSRFVRDAVRTYIAKTDLSSEEIKRVEGPAGFWTESVRPTLALLRGLVACNVLSLALMQKRWRVNYGLTSDRCPHTLLAVPYRAKDQPSARSEFSQPDVVITLTCLAYYYGGLTDDDLFLAFDQLLGSDQAEIEYGRWVRWNTEVPAKFKTLAGVNTEDTEQCVKDIFPHLRLSKAVIDYFLDHIVYPKAMKEFPSKLSTSGWDLGEQKVHPTTGFSGTNDSRRLLPLGMEQLDLDEQNHTNALVMSYLLQGGTSVIDIPPRSPTQASDADALLDLVVGLEPPVRVILDVGAQVLELGNLQVARQWLERVTNDHTHAAVFFDNDELSVVDRNGYTERLQTSPFASQLDACLIFLDEAHTRGTDLKLPTDYRAAVTLGANQTKDGLMQGCMRMRKLGHGQSVVFCVPREIKTKMKELLPEGRTGGDIQVSDILLWSIRETWNSLHRDVQLWAAQGRRHEKHRALWKEFTGGERELNADQAKEFLEDEAQTILERYRPEGPDKEKTPGQNSKPGANPDPISDRLRDFGVSRCDAATLHEEQERELAPEIETERQTELPPPTVHAPHSVHPDVTTFATKGTMVPNSKAYLRAFVSLSNTRAGREFRVSDISPMIAPTLYVTADFARTVKLPDAGGVSQDSYLRSVQWVLVSQQAASEPVMLIVSPFEANKLVSRVGKVGKTTLYLYSPRINPAYPSLDDLSLFPFPHECGEPIPQELTVALNLFAGQLYFNDYNLYVAACKFLGLSSEKAKDGELLDADGFILSDGEGRVGGGSGFSESPVKFIRDLTLMRRDHQTISGTHVGDMLDNRVLSEETFE